MRRSTALAVATMVVGVVLALGIRATGDGPDAKAGESKQTQISWDEARALITGCGVREVGQTHALSVTLTLRDGARRFTREPAIDDVVHVLNGTQGKCGPVTFATE
jgi:hypothetical protein